MDVASRRVQAIAAHLASGGGALTHTDALRAKYELEKEKRQNAEGNGQYLRLKDLAADDERFARMLADPWSSEEVSSRAPLLDEVEVLIVGAGYGGLCAGARLREQGLAPHEVRIVDTASQVGGTWYWNRYPGAQCDIESYTYAPLCEELGYIPTEKYARQPELLAHSQMIAVKYDLLDNACLSTVVTGMVWDEAEGRWTVTTNRGDRMRARFVITNFGTFTQPKLPKVPGLASFEGHMFHTSRWDYEYTGGTSMGGLDKLHNKRVGVIGTGATSVQIVPHLGQAAKELCVFQRTPSSVDVRNQRTTDLDVVREQMTKPGWQRERMVNFVQMTQTPTVGVTDLIQDGWTDSVKNLFKKFHAERWAALQGGNKAAVRRINELMELADFEQMEKIRARADSIVDDPTTAEALKPYYRQFCKRPCFHDEYLPTFNKPNVKLVDTDGKGVERITPKGIVVAGKEYELDCIIMATGFETGYTAEELGPQKAGFELVGRHGVKLSDKWAKGPRTLNSFSTHGFPNLFMQNAPQGTLTTNFVHTLDEIAQHAAYIIGRMREKGHRCFDPSKEAEDAYCQRIWDRSHKGKKFLEGCTPGYYNKEGKLTQEKTLDSMYGDPLKFFAMLSAMRDEGRIFDGINVE